MLNRKSVLAIISIFALLSVLAWFRLASAPPIAAQGPTTHSIYLPLIQRACVSAQLVRDSSFELGLPNADWVTTSTVASEILDNTPSIPAPNPTHTGNWKAWLVGYNSIQETLYQTLIVPPGTPRLRIGFWRYITTQESSPFINDRLDIQIRDNSGALLETLYTLWDGDANGGTTWTQHILTPTNPYAGQTVRLVFLATTDATEPTSFFVDDVTATVMCQP
jgi:hypothetical protein